MFARCQMVTVADVGAGNVGDLEVRKQQPNLLSCCAMRERKAKTGRQMGYCSAQVLQPPVFRPAVSVLTKL